ncbi:MAG: alpha-galactosidase [Actinomycetota bacterium]|nr:alpha-galactosidase [Actinomycetota bacterium]
MATRAERAGDSLDPGETLLLEDEHLRLEVRVGGDSIARVVSFGAQGTPRAGTALPLVDVVVAGVGRGWCGGRYAESVVGERMRHDRHRRGEDGSWSVLEVSLVDAETGLRVDVVYRLLRGHGALTTFARLRNDSDAVLVVDAVTSLLLPGLDGPSGDLADVSLHYAENSWLAEGRWRAVPLRAVLPDLARAAHEHDSRGRFGITSTGSWPSGTHLPMGASVGAEDVSFAWQVEHNGPWHWQVGEFSARDPRDAGTKASGTGAYLAALGPTREEHDFSARLAPGEVFESVPATIGVSRRGLAGSFAALTAYRRAARRPHPDHERLPVVFNDYMNTLMGDPTTARLLPLVDAAAEVGAECFCIDAGWFASLGEPWWQSVGRWTPSTDRFPSGIGEVLGAIRERGLVAGLWIEPEVVGVDSPVAGELPAEAFFARDGVRVLEQDRYLLDLRNPAARSHVDSVVDRLVDELGIGYLKIDYNVDTGVGTDARGEQAGTGLLGHNRAVLAWLDSVLDRHPGLTLESCASGGLRTDFATLGRCQLHSTSDQQDFRRYPPIAAAALAAVPFEQAANWSYPQPGDSEDEVAFKLVTGLVGRMYLSGHLDRMEPRRRALVSEAVALHKELRTELSRSHAFWPIGLPGWEDAWTAVGLASERVAVVALWHRGEKSGEKSESVAFVLPEAVARLGDPEILFPSSSSARLAFERSESRLEAHLAATPSACLVGFGHRGYAPATEAAAERGS